MVRDSRLLIPLEASVSPPVKTVLNFALNPELFAGEYIAPAGTFDCPQEAVRRSLSEFPAIEYHQGWIPEALSSLPEKPYSFVNIDLNLHDPIRGAIDFLSSIGERRSDHFG